MLQNTVFYVYRMGVLQVRNEVNFEDVKANYMYYIYFRIHFVLTTAVFRKVNTQKISTLHAPGFFGFAGWLEALGGLPLFESGSI